MNIGNYDEKSYFEHKCIHEPVQNKMTNEYRYDDENDPTVEEISHTAGSNEAEFVECALHTPENSHIKDECCAQNENSIPFDFTLQRVLNL